jgi:hypothetical protein
MVLKWVLVKQSLGVCTDLPLVVVQLLVFSQCSSSGFVATWLINYSIISEVHTKAWWYDWNMSQVQT